MSDSLADLLATDAELDRIARREGDCSDLVLAELSLLAAAIDDVPLPPVVPCVTRPVMTSVRKGGWALTVTVALMVTSSGVAAAVTDNPLGPLHYMTKQVWRIGPHSGGKLPGWQLDGAMPISTVPGARGSATSGGAGDGVTPGQPGYGALAGPLGTPDARLAGRAGSADAGRVGRDPRSGSGGRDPSSRPLEVNSRPTPPGGLPPGNNPGNGTGTPTNPTLPGGPGHLRDGNQAGHHAGQPAAGRVPGSGTQHCRIDHADVPGMDRWTGPGTALHPCAGHSSTPTRPGAGTGPGAGPHPGTGPGAGPHAGTGPGAGQGPGKLIDGVPGAPTGPGGPGLASSASPTPRAPRESSSAPTGTTPEPSGLTRWIP